MTIYSAEYEQVLKDVERSRLELGDTPFVTLRALRLVAEAYAVKGYVNKNVAFKALCC